MDIKTPVIIFSTDRTERNLRENAEQHQRAVAFLERNNVMFLVGEGHYKGVHETAIMVVLYNAQSEKAARTLATLADQDSILYCDAERLARLETCDGDLIETLGRLVCVSASEAIQEDAYTVMDDKYYVTRPISDVEQREQNRRGALKELADVAARITEFNKECVGHVTDSGKAWELLHDTQDIAFRVLRCG